MFSRVVVHCGARTYTRSLRAADASPTAFEEELHPRNEHGEFTEKGTGAAPASAPSSGTPERMTPSKEGKGSEKGQAASEAAPAPMPDAQYDAVTAELVEHKHFGDPFPDVLSRMDAKDAAAYLAAVVKKVGSLSEGADASPGLWPDAAQPARWVGYLTGKVAGTEEEGAVGRLYADALLAANKKDTYGGEILRAMRSSMQVATKQDDGTVSGGFSGIALERIQARVERAGGADKGGAFPMFSADFATMRNAFVGQWVTVGGSVAYRRAYASLQDEGANASGRFWLGNPPLSEGERAVSPLLKAHLEQIAQETQAFYRKKFKGKDPAAVPLVAARGVGGDAASYTPAPVESWSLDKRTPVWFGKIMGRPKRTARRGTLGTYSVLEAKTTYGDVFMSWESLKGVWPPEDRLRGKKEVVLFGGALKDITKTTNSFVPHALRE